MMSLFPDLDEAALHALRDKILGRSGQEEAANATRILAASLINHELAARAAGTEIQRITETQKSTVFIEQPKIQPQKATTKAPPPEESSHGKHSDIKNKTTRRRK